MYMFIHLSIYLFRLEPGGVPGPDSHTDEEDQSSYRRGQAGCPKIIAVLKSQC